jgi:hypothetical protein
MVRLMGAMMIGLGLVFVVVSMKLNYLAGFRLGETPEEGQVFAWVAVAVAGTNAALPFAITVASRRCEWGLVAAGTMLFAVFLAYSLGSALGYAAGNRGAVVVGREAVTANFQAALNQENDLRGELEPIANTRPADVIQADLRRLKQDRVWTQTSACSDATASASREFCKGYHALEAELAGSVQAVRVRADLQRVTTELAKLRAHGAGRESDPQASLLSRLFGLTINDVRSAWSVLFAVLVELGCAFVPFIGLSILGIRHGAASMPHSCKRGEEPLAIDAHLLPQAPKRAARLGRRGGGRIRLRRMPTALPQLPPLRKAEFGEDGQLKITDE